MKLIENSLNASYNLQKVDWKDFDEHLQKTKDKMIIKMQRITSLKAKVIYLTECIKNTVKLFIFKQRICAKSKLWWNNEFIKMQKMLLSKKLNLKKMQKWRRMSRDSANAKFILWCNKADQKSILNQFFKQCWRKKSVSDIQVH